MATDSVTQVCGYRIEVGYSHTVHDGGRVVAELWLARTLEYNRLGGDRLVSGA